MIVNHDKHLVRELADAFSKSRRILEAYTSAPFIKMNDSNKTIWSKIDGQWDMLVTFSLSEFDLKKKCVLLGHFMWMTILSHQGHTI
jgi:hypothetical protein